jgi:hypothetical protein
MAKSLVTKKFKDLSVELFKEELEEGYYTYYAFIGKQTAYTPTDSSIPQPTDSVQDTDLGIYKNIAFAKKITAADAKHMVPRYDWTSNTTYVQYDDADPDLFSKKYFVVVYESSTYYVYKCIYSPNTTSTSVPTRTDTSPSDTFYETSDGYQWKYMYSVDNTTFNKFSTQYYMPVIPDANVSGNAINGSIDLITVTEKGARYDNFISGAQFKNASELIVNGNEKVYQITANNASSISNFYKGCYLYIVTSSSAQSQYREISNYISNSSGNFVVLNSAFNSIQRPQVNDIYDISPKIVINGSDYTTNAEARAIINTTSSNSIQKVSMLNRGAGYTYAVANVYVDASVPVTANASLRVILPPYGGHGHDSVEELGGSRLGISVKFNNTENDTITTNNDFRTIGLIKNPVFANVTLQFDTNSGIFSNNEYIYTGNTVALLGSVSVNTSSNVVAGNSSDFSNGLSIGDYIVISTNTSYQLTKVAGITNSSYMTIVTNGYFSNTTSNIYKFDKKTQAQISNVDSVGGTIMLTNVIGTIANGDKIFGNTSGNFANVTSVAINGDVKGFDTFNQMYKYNITTVTGGPWVDDELIYQPELGIQLANAYFHSTESVNSGTRLYTTNQLGRFVVNTSINNIKGATSNTVATVTEIWPPDTITGSGDIIYIENISPVARSNTTTETLKFIIEF